LSVQSKANKANIQIRLT